MTSDEIVLKINQFKDLLEEGKKSNDAHFIFLHSIIFETLTEAVIIIENLWQDNQRLGGRFCVNCGRTFPASYDRTKTPNDCPSPAACTIDMTMEEAYKYFKQKYHLSNKLVAELKSKLAEFENK